MAKLEWSENMSVGLPTIDSDHKCLIRIIDLLHHIHHEGDSQRMIETVLDTLLVYGRYHFDREERVMAECHFPGRAFHRSEHRGFAKYIDNLHRRFKGKGDPKLARQLLDYLSGWLTHHILIQDMAFKPYVVGNARVEDVARAAGPSLLNMANHAAFRAG